MKRFWKRASVVPLGHGFAIELDGRRVRTPARAELAVPTAALADAVAAEWNAAGDEVDPRAMPLTGLANAAIDRVEPARAAFAADLARYAEGDLLCYRAEGPARLVAREADAWDPLLAWARRFYDIDFVVTDGLTHVPQPAETVRKLGHAAASLDNFRLAALSPLVTIGGSLVAALAVLEEAALPEAAWDAVSLDDRWQLEQWGEDAEARRALDLRQRDFLAAARFLSLVR